MQSLNETSELLIFKAISTFVIELGRVYEKDHVPLGLYKRLILKTKVSHVKPIKKHIEAFRKWLKENSEAVELQDSSLLEGKEKDKVMIKYSENAYIDMRKIFTIAVKDELTDTIWKHLKTIDMLLNGNQGAIVEEKYEKEKDFISDVMKKVETHVDPDADPTQVLNNMMSSGVFTDLLSNMNKGITSGELDLSKLLGMTTGMLSSLQKNLEDKK